MTPEEVVRDLSTRLIREYEHTARLLKVVEAAKGTRLHYGDGRPTAHTFTSYDDILALGGTCALCAALSELKEER